MFNLEELKNPPTHYYPAPFWFWNDNLQYDELKWQMEQMKQQHVYEVFIHARKGLLVPYMSEEWLARIGFVIETAKKLGLKIWLYDEDNFPSGYAGGKVLEENPDFCGKNLRVNVLNSVKDIESIKDKNIIAVFVQFNDEFILQSSYDFKALLEQNITVYVFSKEYTYWHPAYSEGYYIDILNRDACESFMKHTHKIYESRFGNEFGKTVKGFFTDEAGFYNNLKLLPWSNLDDSDTIVWTDTFSDYFKNKNGYDIISRLPHIFYNLHDSHIYRRDFYETTCDMYLDNFLLPQKNYCEERGMLFVGHLHMEDFLPYHVVGHGNFTRALNGLSYAGTDRIDQNNEKINEKVVSSFGHQYNKPRVLSETYALTTWALNFTEMRRIANYQYVRGINMIVQHAFYFSIREERMWECPPSQFYQNPYWKHYSLFSDYIARLSYILTRGNHIADIAIYYPIANAQCSQTPFDWQCSEEHDVFLQNVANSLLEAQVDFDFVNDEAFEIVEKNTLKVNDEYYNAVIIPDVKHMPYKTLLKLYELSENGVAVIFIRNLPKYCTELNMQKQFDELLGRIMILSNTSLMARNIIYKAYTYKFSVQNLFEFTSIKNIVKKDLFLDRADGNIKYLHRRDGENDIYFITNEAQTACKHTFSFNAKGTPCIIDPIDGVKRGVSYECKNNQTLIDLSLREYDGIFIVFESEQVPDTNIRDEFKKEICINLSDDFTLYLNSQTYKAPLKEWSELGQPYFSGEGIYKTNINLQKEGNTSYILSLGEVCDLAELIVNGQKVCVMLFSPYEADITSHIEDGENEIEIRVINSVINEFEKNDRKSGLVGPVKIKICK
jgi:hypothetical protein